MRYSKSSGGRYFAHEAPKEVRRLRKYRKDLLPAWAAPCKENPCKLRDAWWLLFQKRLMSVAEVGDFAAVA